MHDFQIDISKSLEVLKTGGLILYPTDTVWAVGCDATNDFAVEKLYALLKRPLSTPSVVLVANERTILEYATQIDLQIFDTIVALQQPTTVVYKGVIGFAEALIASDGSAAMRIATDTFCKHLTKRFQQPIVSAYASFTVENLPTIFHNIDAEIINGVDYCVQYNQDTILSNALSAIVQLEKNGTLTYLRR